MAEHKICSAVLFSCFLVLFSAVVSEETSKRGKNNYFVVFLTLQFHLLSYKFLSISSSIVISLSTAVTPIVLGEMRTANILPFNRPQHATFEN